MMVSATEMFSTNAEEEAEDEPATADEGPLQPWNNGCAVARGKFWHNSAICWPVCPKTPVMMRVPCSTTVSCMACMSQCGRRVQE